MAAWRDALLEWLYPVTAGCLICGREVPVDGEGLCEECRKALKPVPDPACPRCGRPGDGRGCCHEPYYSTAAAHCFLYTGSAREAVLQLKFKQRGYIAELMRPVLHRRLEQMGWPQPDAIVPVPTTRKRRRLRGYNQAEMLARALGRESGIPVAADWLRRVKEGGSQVGLTAAQRRLNLQGAFQCSREAAGKRVLLVDDVFTTGTTAEACCRTLLRAGAKEVYVLCLCVAMPEAENWWQPGERATDTARGECARTGLQ